MTPSSESVLHARKPSSVSGTLIVMLSPSVSSLAASRSMSSAPVATTSADTGPSTSLAISAMTSRKLLPDLAIRLGLVVTPSSSPVAASSSISRVSAVSTKNFMAAASCGDALL